MSTNDELRAAIDEALLDAMIAAHRAWTKCGTDHIDRTPFVDRIIAALEGKGEEPQFDKNRGYTQPQVNEGSCDVCDMRWTGYGTQCPVCEGER